MAAMAVALRDFSQASALLVDLEAHGREEIVEGVNLTRTVGWFTAICPVLLDLDPTLGAGELLKALKEQLRGLPRRGLGHGLARYLSGDRELAEELEALPRAQVSFNYLGQLDQALPGSSPFGPAPESAGPNHGRRRERPYLLDFSGYVAGGRLQVAWAYSENLLDRSRVSALAEDFLAALRSLIAHCLSPEAGGYTPSDFPLAALDQATVDRLAAEMGEIEDVYPLSPVQQGLFFHALESPGSGAYFMQVSCTLRGEIDDDAFDSAWRRVLERHTILRTAFVWEGLEAPLQVVRPRLELPLEVSDWSGLSTAEQKARLAVLLRADRERGFELSRAPLLRVARIRRDATTHQLIWSYHHLLLDGWSVPLLLQEVFAFYESAARGVAPEPEPPRPFRGYIEWVGRQDLARAEAFWRRHMAGFTAPTPLMADRVQPVRERRGAGSMGAARELAATQHGGPRAGPPAAADPQYPGPGSVGPAARPLHRRSRHRSSAR